MESRDAKKTNGDGQKWAARFRLIRQRHPRPDGTPWSYAEIARAAGIKASWVGHLARGDINKPGPDKLHRVARGMRFDPGEWFREDNSGRPSAAEVEAAVEKILSLVKGRDVGKARFWATVIVQLEHGWGQSG